jgi:hypothetical protein
VDDGFGKQQLLSGDCLECYGKKVYVVKNFKEVDVEVIIEGI